MTDRYKTKKIETFEETFDNCKPTILHFSTLTIVNHDQKKQNATQIHQQTN
jgi:hypothetical protein